MVLMVVVVVDKHQELLVRVTMVVLFVASEGQVLAVELVVAVVPVVTQTAHTAEVEQMLRYRAVP